MNKQERAALVLDQFNAGIKNGTAIAGIVIKKFPDGFSSETGIEVRKITDNALAHVINKLSANGIERKYRKPFADGFNKGLAKTYAEYAKECASRENLRTNEIE